MSKKKVSAKHNNAQSLPIELTKPIILTLVDDCATDEVAARGAWREREERLLALARHYNFPLNSPECIFALLNPITLCGAEKLCPSLKIKIVRKKARSNAGRKPSRNTLSQDALLCAVREAESILEGEYGSATRAAKRVAIFELQGKGRQFNRSDVKSFTKTLQTRLSQFRDDEWREASQRLLKKIFPNNSTKK